MGLDQPTVDIERDEKGRLQCPCGNPSQARYHRQPIRAMCADRNHLSKMVLPSECDEPDGTASSTLQPSVSSFNEGAIIDPAGCEDSAHTDGISSALQSSNLPFNDVVMAEVEPALDNEPDSNAMAVDSAVPDNYLPPDPEDPRGEDQMVWVPFDENEPILEDDLPVEDWLEIQQSTLSEELEPSQNEIVDAVEHYELHSGNSLTDRLCIETLRNHGILVNPSYHWTICLECGVPKSFHRIYHHVRTAHIAATSRAARVSEAYRPLPPEGEIMEMLVFLQAHKPEPWPDVPIDPIPGMNEKTAYRCLHSECSAVYGSSKSCRIHWGQAHREARKLDPICTPIPVHPLGGFRSQRQFLELTQFSSDQVDDFILQEILGHADKQGLGVPSTIYNVSGNVRDSSLLFTQLRWNAILDKVLLPPLRSTTVPPSKGRDEGPYQIILLSTRMYYKHTMSKTSTVSTITLRWIHSSNPE